MPRYRLVLTPAQEAVLRDHCAHARYGWNLAVEQHAHWHPGPKSAPGYLEQCRQLTAVRTEHDWLRAGCQMVQQQALRDFAQAVAASFDRANPAKRPGRVEKISPAFTSQRCSACGQVDPKSRESQAVFRCTACRYVANADVNAARNIAAGYPTHLPGPLHARGGCRDAGPVNREPQLLVSFAGYR